MEKGWKRKDYAKIKREEAKRKQYTQAKLF